MKIIELLAPAKDYLSAVAAVDYGADAVYIGGSKFGARQAAGNSVEEVARVVEYAHRYGVRVHATLNTLLWDSELREAEQQARELIATGVDALIVQDMALRRMNLPVELHASTQVCNRTPEGARFLGEVGFARVILERALSLGEIREICAATSAEVECFVHGAICVGHSGRCFLSRSTSGRSGNRGSCSQPCRLPWDLTNGKGAIYAAGKHLLSVQDLNLSARLGELMDAGVTSFKIEGRLKDTNYIRNVVAYYRRGVDEALAERPSLRRASVGRSVTEFTPDPAKSFTRGESEFFLDGKQGGVASFDTPKSVGEFVGRVAHVERHGFWLAGRHTLAAGDGICFITGRGLSGTNINTIDDEFILPNRLDEIDVGLDIFRNYDHQFTRRVESSRTKRVISATATVVVTDQHITLTYTDCEGFVASVARYVLLDKARNAEANGETMREKVSKAGDTVFVIDKVEVQGAEWFVPVSIVAELRREGLARLALARQARTVDHRILPENIEARYPKTRLDAEDNVTNHLAEAFYRDHGVEEIAAPLELAETMVGARVLNASYCIRREMGECLLEKPLLQGDLYLERGSMRYKIEFDCASCEMNLVACGENTTK